MAEHADQFSEANQSETSQPDGSYGKLSTQGSVVTLKLPADLTEKLQRCSQQSGKTQVEIILAILKSAIAKMAPEAASVESIPLKVQQEFQSLRTRIDELETLLPRLEALEGKLMAF